MNKATRWIGAVLGVVLLTGCALPKIDTARLPAPRSVVIHEIPPMRSIAIMGVVVDRLPVTYFSRASDGLFAIEGVQPPPSTAPNYAGQADQAVLNQIVSSPQPVSIGTGAAMGLAGGIAGAIVQTLAEETARKAADFPAMVRKALPGDLHTELMKTLQDSLETKGIQVRLAPETRNMPPRPRWPGKDSRGDQLVPGPLAASPPVDADLLVQVSPIALYAASAPAAMFKRKVGIGLAIYNGRTREFIGWQAIHFDPPDAKFEYFRYDELAADIDQAAPALAAALLSLVPQVVRIISAEAAM